MPLLERASPAVLYPFLHLMPNGYFFVMANYQAVLFNFDTGDEIVLPDIPGKICRSYPWAGEGYSARPVTRLSIARFCCMTALKNRDFLSCPECDEEGSSYPIKSFSGTNLGKRSQLRTKRKILQQFSLYVSFEDPQKPFNGFHLDCIFEFGDVT